MSGKTFVDSNVLIYAYDSEAGTKHRIANSLLRELWEHRLGVLSLQVLQEFYVNATRKIGKPIPKSKAQVFVENYLSWCSDTTAQEISTAFRIEAESRINFWDALIVASAIKRGASRILSEDLHSGQRIAGVLIENPFVLQ
jgi:predicted nucleic acid-binding protein